MDEDDILSYYCAFCRVVKLLQIRWLCDMSLWETFHRKYESRQPLPRHHSNPAIQPSQQPNRTRCLPSVYDESVQHPGRAGRIRQWGRHLARKKLIHASSASDKSTTKHHQDPTKNDDIQRCYVGGPANKVIYRQREDWSRQQGYLACAFLDTQDTVLACDRSGCIDVVRIPSSCHDVDDDTSTKLGTVLVDALDLRLRDNMPVIPPKLHSLKGGQAFVVAWGGSYHIFASERLRSWGQDGHLPPATTFATRSPSLFFTTSWTLQGPRRKYYRDYQHKALSLTTLAKNKNNNQHSQSQFLDQSHLLQEIQGWNDAMPKEDHSRLFRHHKKVVPSSHWDFFETGSSLLAARVDSEQDSFWMRLMDDRIHHEPVVCVDTTSHDTKPFCEEHIVACAFASSHLLATAHVTCRGQVPPQSGSAWHSTTSSWNHGEQENSSLQSFVKLWDIRMISATRKENYLSTIHLPTFPNTTAVAMSPMLTVDMSQESKESNNNFVLSSLTSSSLDRGTLLLTAHSQHESIVDHYILNLGHLGIERIHRQSYQNEFLLFGTSANHDVLACVEEPHEIKLFDIQEGFRSRRPKRRVDGSLKPDSDNQNASHSSGPIYARIPLDIKDRHGLDTHLSCMAMNAPGTCLVGGSVDGDLVVWGGV